MNIEDIKNVLEDINKGSKSPLFSALGDPSSSKADIRRVKSERLSIDLVLGGGWPVGRIVELFGQESSGKTTIALHAIAAFQREFPEKFAVLVDYEHAFDKAYAKNLGVDIEKLVIAQPTFLEEGIEGIDKLIDSKKVSIIVVDSVAAMTPTSELEGDMQQASVGIQAKLLNKTLRKLTGKSNMTDTTLLFINQLREKIGVMFGNPWVTTGGHALKFFSSIRLEVRKGTKNKDKDSEVTGNHGKLIGVKNKTYKPFVEYDFDIEFGYGVSRFADILNLGISTGIITKKGSWFYYIDDKEEKISLGQGTNNAIEFLKDNEEFSLQLEEALFKALI